jgi:uncharacterized protein (TIGR02266 family)
MADDERRKHQRTPMASLVRLRFNTFDDFLAEYSVDLSEGGLFIRSDAPHPVGAAVDFQFTFRNGQMVEGTGKVVRVRKPGPGVAEPGMAISFTRIDSKSAGVLLQALLDKTNASRKP